MILDEALIVEGEWVREQQGEKDSKMIVTVFVDGYIGRQDSLQVNDIVVSLL